MITQEQRELRKRYVGSSDAAAIMGLDPYRSAADVFLEKTVQADGFEGNENTDRGNLLEPVVLNWAEQQLHGVFLRDVMVVHPNGLLAANLDAYQPKVHIGGVNDEPFIVEAKTTVDCDDWGEPGSDEIPDRVLVQSHHQMIVAGPEYRVVYVPVLMPAYRAFEFRMYRVTRNEELSQRVEDAGSSFMERFVRSGTRPDDFKPSLEVLKRIRRLPNKTIELPDEVVDAWTFAKAVAKDTAENVKVAETALLAAMRDAEAGTFAKGTITYFETNRKGYSVEPCTYRTLRLKGAKQ